MIDLYTWYTPNGRKISIALEEMQLPYNVHPVNIGKGEQHDPEFLKISPNNKIPAIVDTDTGVHLMESGVILLYLAEKCGKFAPTDERGRWEMMEWLMFQMASLGPMLGQTHQFVHYRQGQDEYASERYLNENRRLYGVLDRRLEGRQYVLGDTYSIVDMACFPWIGRWNWQTMNLDEYPNVKRWFLELAARPAVQKGWRVPENDQPLPMPD